METTKHGGAPHKTHWPSNIKETVAGIVIGPIATVCQQGALAGMSCTLNFPNPRPPWAPGSVWVRPGQ